MRTVLSKHIVRVTREIIVCTTEGRKKNPILRLAPNLNRLVVSVAATNLDYVKSTKSNC